MSAVINKIPDWAIGGAALAIGGAALYLYFRGAKGAAKDATETVGNALAGVADGVVNLGFNAAGAAGKGFVDLTQATFEHAQERVSVCDYGSTGGVMGFATGACLFSNAIKNALGFGSGSSSDANTTDSPMTAPGGGIIGSDESTFFSIFDGPNDGSGGFATFDNPVPNPVAGTGTSWFTGDAWGLNYAPSQPIRIGSSEYVRDAFGSTRVVPVTGLRG